ncbi:hypothetical protein B0H14DRAFT_3078164 [Mycena olivaceomarginata]|nr:hypothetical protein B0H14DRAFT_3078164 [Mycena olivaceomarginata]
MPSYSTLYRTLDGLSVEEASTALNHGRDRTKTGVFLFDNVQNLARVRDLQAGKTIDVSVFDLNDKRRCIADNLRAGLTVDQLLGFLDREDADTTGVLVRCIKPLHHFKDEVSGRYRATAKLTIPLEKAVVHPLAASGKKETIPSELKDGLLDFLAQLGQVPTDYIPRKLIIGGDGLSYAMVLQLQTYLQFHKDSFKSFEILEPQLQIWHTKWTDLNRVFQTHWGRTSGKNTNPASLGHSASKIGRAPPPNLKKVDFLPRLATSIPYCWRGYFHTLRRAGKDEKLPAFEDLVTTARSLHRTYSTARARDHAIVDIGASSLWAQTIPTGSKWVPVEIEESSLLQTKKKVGKRQTKPKPVPPPCKGDFVLAQAMDFLRDGLNSQKNCFCMHKGHICYLRLRDPTHSNYMNYLLETIINLELEGDYIVEFLTGFSRRLSKHKNAQFDDNFIRNIISRNLHHIAELKRAWRIGTGMAKKSSKHSDPHANPEMQILLRTYPNKKLRTGALANYIKKTLRTRATKRAPETTTDPAPGDAIDDESDSESSESESEDSDGCAIHGYCAVFFCVGRILSIALRNNFDGLGTRVYKVTCGS